MLAGSKPLGMGHQRESIGRSAQANDRPVWRPKRARLSLAQRLWSVSADKEQREKNTANLARKMHNHGTLSGRDDTSACLCSAKAEQCWQGSVSSVPGSITLLIPAATNLATTPPLLDRCTHPRAYPLSLCISNALPHHCMPNLHESGIDIVPTISRTTSNDKAVWQCRQYRPGPERSSIQLYTFRRSKL